MTPPICAGAAPAWAGAISRIAIAWDPLDGRVNDDHWAALGSVALDPAFVSLGAPVWVETSGPTAIRRLMVAQDTGTAIRGPQRADIFCGTGDAAGEAAGRMREPGRMLVLLPAGMADARVSGR